MNTDPSEERLRSKRIAEALATQPQLAKSKTQALSEREDDIKLLNEKLVRTNERLAAANCDLETFSYSVAHDLRAPLRQITGFSKILIEDYSSQLPSEATRFIDKIAQGAQQMGTLIDDLLHLSQIGRHILAPETTALSEVVESAIQLLQPECVNRRIEWSIGELGDVICDRGLIKQVFVNLLSNALKYSRDRDPAKIEVGLTLANDRKTFFVRDNGVGFDPRYSDKLFGTFQRLHSASEFEGTGIGLATVARIVRKHGGKIWAEAEVEQGASFFFTVPNLRPRPTV